MNAVMKWLAVSLTMVLLTARLAPAAEAAGANEAAPAAHGEGGAEHQPKLFAPVPEGLITAVTTLIVFAALLAVLGRFAWGPIVVGLKAREERIRRDIADAEQTRAKAEATLREYTARLAEAENKVREMISGATTQGEKIAAEIRAKGQQEAEDAKDRAVKDIDVAKKQAVRELYETAAELSTSVASKILRRNINADDQRDLVRQSLEQLQAVGK